MGQFVKNDLTVSLGRDSVIWLSASQTTKKTDFSLGQVGVGLCAVLKRDEVVRRNHIPETYPWVVDVFDAMHPIHATGFCA